MSTSDKRELGCGFCSKSGSARVSVSASTSDLRRVLRRSIAAFCVLVGGVLLWSAPALALSQRGHVFSFSFGGTGAGEGQFAGPSGVAVHEVNATTDEVYVADHANNRVERFKCTIKASPPEEHTCAFLAQFEVPSPEGVAVDNSGGPSSGDVYVVDKAKKNAIYKLRPEGETALAKVLILKGTKEQGGTVEPFEAIHGVAVDANGGLWVYQGESEGVPLEGVIDSFTKDEKNIFLSSRSVEVCGPRSGFAVTPLAEFFYLNHQALSAELGECEEEEAGSAPSVIAKFNSSAEQPLLQALDSENTTGVAVDPSSGQPSSGDVFIDNVTNVAAFNSAGSLIQRFGTGQLSAGSGVAVDSRTGAVFVADSKENKVDVFTLEPVGKPTVDSVSSRNITPTSTELSAQIDPHGADTHYYFQYGTVDCRVSPSSCTDVPAPPPGADLGSGSEFGARTVSVQLMGLQPGTTYFYRVIAQNQAGEAENAATLNTFTTVPTAVGVLADHRAWQMVSPPNKSGAAIEAIPAEEGLIQASEDGSAFTYLVDAPIGEEPGGNRAPERTQILSTREPTAWSSQDIATPHETASGVVSGFRSEYQFFSPTLSLGIVDPFGQTPRSEPPLAPESPEKTIYVRDDPPRLPDASEQLVYQEAEKNRAYLSPGYLPLVSKANVPVGTKFAPDPFKGEQLGFSAATPDLNHAILDSSAAGVALSAEPAGPKGNLYEWSAGKPPTEQLQLVNVLPDGTPASESTLGGDNSNIRHAISDNGSRVFWSNEAEGLHLYTRDMTERETVKVDAAEEGVTEPTNAEAKFQVASKDGSRVFFTDTQRLTKDSTASPNEEAEKADLYECEIVEKGGKLACNLKDLTAQNPGEAADVQGMVLGASEDGSYVYFVANGALARGAATGNCINRRDGTEPPPPGAACNVYVEHYNGEAGKEKWEEPTFIARVSNEDGRGWEEFGAKPNLEKQPVRVSPNGQFLAFMSQQRLTAYDNTDQSSGKPDDEVYLYDAGAPRLVCASCNPNGAPPAGVFDTRHAGEGIGLLVDRQELWSGHRLAGSIPAWAAVDEKRAVHQYGYLSDNGRLYFNSPVALVPEADKNGKEDVYQFEPNGIGTCSSEGGCVSLISSGTATRESAFLDASASGNDVFFLTAAQLLPQDVDTGFDVYDASVCGQPGAPACLPPAPLPTPPCATADECRPAPSPPPLFGAPASAAFSGPGNLAKQETLPFTVTKPRPLTRAQLLARALKACKKQPKKKRAACQKRARKRYGAKSKAKKSSTRSGKRRK